MPAENAYFQGERDSSGRYRAGQNDSSGDFAIVLGPHRQQLPGVKMLAHAAKLVFMLATASTGGGLLGGGGSIGGMGLERDQRLPSRQTPLRASLSSSMRTALLVIDLQNDFTRDTGKLPACIEQIPEVIERINRAVQRRNDSQQLSAIVTTQWSSPIVRLLTGNSVKPGSFGAGVDERLSAAIPHRFVKRNKDIFSSSELVAWLAENRVERLILSGLALEHCLFTSAKTAIARGFAVGLLQGGAASFRCHAFDNALTRLRGIGVDLCEG